jgi:hypothetical protein
MLKIIEYLINLINKKEKEKEDLPSIQLEIPKYYSTIPDKKQEKEEKKSKVIIIDM